MKKKFYITAAIPYVNAKPHIGHALEFVQADVIARYHRLLGEDVLLLSGGDENALKNVQAAEKAGKEVQPFIDENNQYFVDLVNRLNTTFDVWQRGSDKEKHFKASQKLWQLCLKNGDIYKKRYSGLYCIGCETFYTPDELDEKLECFEHPGKKLDEVEEENYFFSLSNYSDKIVRLIQSDEIEILPSERKNEVLGFLKSGLLDISISRSNSRAKNWGVPVPGDDSQRMYVWFDALNIYQSGVGFGWKEEKYLKYWPADLHVIGKGIVRFHAVFWPAFLLSAGLPLPKRIFVHGYYTVGGQKMSKTIGNVFDPVPLLEKYGADPLRYYMLAKTPPFADGDFSLEKFVDTYNSDLANGLGNTVSRVAKLAETSGFDYAVQPDNDQTYSPEQQRLIEGCRFDELLRLIWNIWLNSIDQRIEQDKPWTLTGQQLKTHLQDDINDLVKVAKMLQPFLPETSEKIIAQFSSSRIRATSPLFPRIV